MYEQNYQQTIDLNQLPKVRNGAMWYVALLPALAAFLENYAINKWLELLVWGFVLIACPAICHSDAVKLERMGIGNAKMKKEAVICPVAYMFMRCKTLRQGSMKAVLFTIFTGFAIMGNGFTVSLSMDDNAFIERVKNSYAVNLEDLSDEMSFNIIGKQLNSYISEDEAKYEIITDGDKRYVTAKGTDPDGKKLEIVFLLDYDGYAFKCFKVDSITLDGSELSADEQAELLKKIFIEADDDNSDRSSSLPQGSESSDDSYTKA